MQIGASAASGLGWGHLAILLSGGLGGGVVNALPVSPFLGILIGFLTAGFADRRIWFRAVVSGISLYAAAVVFAIAIAVANNAARVPERFEESLTMVVVGVTLMLWLLWPLSGLNHELMWTLVRSKPPRETIGN